MNEPVIEARSGLSVVWLIPLLTALLGGWLIVRALVNEGPLVALTFRTADGIEVGKTRIKYKSLDIGLVESVRFSADFSRVEVAARLSKEAGHFLRRDTRFWVVRPTLSARGISGLGTLLSGAYIEIEPGLGVPQTLFVGLESPPVVHAAEAGTQITLLARKLGSLDRGSLVHYQGLVAGEVLGYEMADDYHSVLIHAFVKPPFDQLVRSNTRFWSASGLDLSLGPDGVRLKTESLQALLFGGIAFDTPAGQDQAADDITGLVFTLHDDQQAIEALGYVQKVRFVLFFAGSVRGLNVGAPVEFKGIKVGAVTSVQLEYDDQTAAFRIPVVIELEPERIIERGESLKKAPREAFQALVKRGLRARLQTGNLLTGQLLVDLDMQPKSPLRLMGAGRAEPELPTVEGDFDQITTQLKGLVAKLDQLDIATIGGQLQATLKGTAAIANSPQIGRAIEGLGASLASLRSILHKLDAHAEPLTTTLEQTLVAARDALEKSQAMMTTLESVVAPESPLHDNVLRLTRDLSQTARALRGLVDTLERNPQSLLFGRQPTDEAP